MSSFTEYIPHAQDDRDVNAAKNILALGHERLAVGISVLRSSASQVEEDVKKEIIPIPEYKWVVVCLLSIMGELTKHSVENGILGVSQFLKVEL